MAGYRFLSLLTALVVLVSALPGPVRARTAASPSPAVRTAVFAIGSPDYTVDGRVYRMDAAPVLDGGNALVPLRYLAYALGVTGDGIRYQSLAPLHPGLAAVDIERRRAGGSPVEVTLFYSPADPSLDILAPHGLAGGIQIPLDAAPRVAPSGRLLVPCRDLARALGALVAWDPARERVTLTTWETLPAAAPQLTADQVAMHPGGDTITATYGGTPAGARTYPYPVEVANPYYPGPGENPDLYALIPTLEAFGVPAANILWDPAGGQLAVAGSSPFRFLYFTVGTNINDNLTDELGLDLDTPDTGPSVSMVGNEVLYVDNTIVLMLAYGFDLQLTDAAGNDVDPILDDSGNMLSL